MKPMRCPHCDHRNPARASVCEKCTGMLPLGDPTRDDGPMIGHSFKTMRDDSPMNDYNARGRRFMLTFFALAMAFVAAGLHMFYVAPMSGGLDPESRASMMLGLGTLGYLAFAFLLGKTAQSVGLRFLPTFLGALAPVLIPGLLARIARRPWWLPYVYLMGIATGMYLLSLAIGDQPMIYGTITLFVLPFVIYCLFGAAVAELGPALGYHPILSVLWLCALPVLLYVFLLRFTLGLSWVEVSMAIDLPSLFANGEMHFTWPLTTLNLMDTLTIVTLIFTGGSFVLWVRSVYENLCLPEEEA